MSELYGFKKNLEKVQVRSKSESVAKSHIVPTLLTDTVLAARPVRYEYNYMLLPPLGEWNVVALECKCGNALKNLIIFRVTGSMSNYMIDALTDIKFRAVYGVDWTNNRIYVRWVDGDASLAAQFVQITKVYGLVQNVDVVDTDSEDEGGDEGEDIDISTLTEEVQGIRIGADGTIYETAGQAVREQYEKLAEMLDVLNVEDAVETIQNAVDTAIQQIETAGGLILDPTLTESGQAADAKVVGQKIEKIKHSAAPYIINTAETLGYIGTTGNIVNPTSFGREIYTDYIQVNKHSVLLFYMYSTLGSAYTMWSKLALYDANKNFKNRVDLYYGSAITNSTTWVNTDDDIAYVRLTYRTGTTAAGQYIYCTITRMIEDEIESQVALNRSVIIENNYINTNVNEGEIVALTPVSFIGFGYAVIPCTSNDVFTITGRGAFNARLWAFVDDNNDLISKSRGNHIAINDVITAPSNATKLIVNFDIGQDYSCYKGVNVSVTNDVRRSATIQLGVVHDLPKNLISFPTVNHYASVQQQSGIAGAKPAIFKNGDYFCITYGENLDGTGTDIPKVTDSGVLAMKYKRFKLVNGVESEVSYGTFAQKGTEYVDYQGNAAMSVGGWGLPSGVENMQYFTTAYTGSHKYNGVENYGMTPCCCTVTVDSTGVTFGDIHELKLNIDGSIGKFDLTRLDANNTDYLLYMTTAAPYHSSAGYKWMMPVRGGIAYFTSENGIDWIYQWTLKTPYQPQCEVMCLLEGGGSLVFAARTQTRNSSESDTLYIGKVSQTGNLEAHYKLPFSASRAFIIRSGGDILLFYTPASKNVNECIRIIIENNSCMHFWRWFTIWEKATWYLTCFNNVFDGTFSKMYICGGNGEVGSTAGMSFIELGFDTTKPRKPNEINFTIT